MDKEIFANAGTFLVLIAMLCIPAILFCLSIQNTLKAIKPDNRKLPVYAGWLLLIPLFSTVWQFVVAVRLAKSIESELNDHGITKEMPTYYPGIVLGIVQVCAYIPDLNSYTKYIWLICFIVYWAVIGVYKSKLTDLRSLSAGANS